MALHQISTLADTRSHTSERERERERERKKERERDLFYISSQIPVVKKIFVKEIFVLDIAGV